MVRFLDDIKFSRRLALYASVGLTAHVVFWAEQAARAGVDALAIAAVTAPVSALMGFAFKFYNEGAGYSQ